MRFYANNKAQRVIEGLTFLMLFPLCSWIEQDLMGIALAINLMILPFGLSALNSMITNMLFRGGKR